MYRFKWTLILSLFAMAAFANNQLGEQIYNQACQTCHNPSTAPLMKAPPAHDVAAWQPRIQLAEQIIKTKTEFKTALDYLVSEVKNGKNAMPPGGMCQDPSTPDKKCTDAAYKAAIEFMSTEQTAK